MKAPVKKLIVSIKTSDNTLEHFKKALKRARSSGLKKDHFELSFDNKKDFDRFVKNLSILSAILEHKPKSVYALAKLLDKDVSTLNKLISFFETIGAITIKISSIGGRTLKTPVVEYKHIEFDLAA